MKPSYYAFDPVQHGEAVIGLEKIAAMLPDLRPLHSEHYHETEVLYTKAPFDPDYVRYVSLENAGQFLVFTVRVADIMIGYLQYYVYRSLHSQTVLQAREDALFLTKSARGRGLAPKILKYAEHCLAQLGCTHVGMSSKAPCGGPDLDAFLKRAGYSPVAAYYVKHLGVADAQATTAKAA